MLLLLDFLLGTILEGPLDYVGFWTSAFDMLALGKLGPEVVEVLEFDQMPYLRKWGWND